LHHAPALDKARLAVAECFERPKRMDPDRGYEFLHEARRIATLAHPNIALVRKVVVRDEHIVVVGDFLDGEILASLWPFHRGAMPLEIALRVLVDVLGGVGALHGLRDTRQRPMAVAHGEIAPGTILVGADGSARVLHAIARRAPGARPDPASLPYLAPEVREQDSYDSRADVFSVGVLLWEALSECPVPTYVKGSENAPPAMPPKKAPWAKGLVEIASRALAASPEARWPTAAAMAAEIRKAAGLRLASVSATATWAEKTFGERVRARRERLEGRAPASTVHSGGMPRVPTPPPPPMSAAVGVPSVAPSSPGKRPAPLRAAVTPSPAEKTIQLLESDFDEMLESPAPTTSGVALDARSAEAYASTDEPGLRPRRAWPRSLVVGVVGGLAVALALLVVGVRHRKSATTPTLTAAPAPDVPVLAASGEPSEPPAASSATNATVSPAPSESATVQSPAVSPSVKPAKPSKRPARPKQAPSKATRPQPR
jgi:serine/threonine-protein kinase